MNIINNYSILEAYRSANLIFEDDDSDKTRVVNDINTPDKPESNYASVTFISIAKDIKSISKNLDNDSGKALLLMFKHGPSKSVLKHGEITVEPVADFPIDTDNYVSDSEDNSDSDKSDSSDNSSNNSSDNSSGGSTTSSRPSSNIPSIRQGRNLPRQGSSSVSSVNSSLVRNNYSILDAYNNIHQINEEDSATEPNSTNEPDKISVGSFLRVRVELKEEGYTDWYIALDTAISSNGNLLHSVENSLKSGRFINAYNDANSAVKTKHLGLAPVAMQTFLYEKPYCGIPWMGHCNYAIGAGADDGNAAFHDIITLSVVPENINEGQRPSKDMLFLARFQIKDVSAVSSGFLDFIYDFVGSNVDWLLGEKQIADRIDTSDKSKDPSTAINKFLTGRKFGKDAAGTSEKYDSFLKIRKWVKENVDKKAFIYLDESIKGRPVSDTVKEYSQQHSKNSKFPIYF